MENIKNKIDDKIGDTEGSLIHNIWQNIEREVDNNVWDNLRAIVENNLDNSVHELIEQNIANGKYQKQTCRDRGRW